MEAYYIIKSILRTLVDSKRVTLRDAISYCSVFLDDNNRKPICRLRFNNEDNLRLELILADGSSEKVSISSIDEIYNYSEQIIIAVQRYI